ncbi:MAG: DUF190 domain-containing protein [Thermoplasmatota archaeon]
MSDLSEQAVKLRIYIGEADRVRNPGPGRASGEALYKAIVALLRERGIWGATVVRGVYGFGKKSVLHATSPLRLSEDLPIVVEAIDSKAKIDAVLPAVSAMVVDGLVTLEDVTVVTHVSAFDPASRTDREPDS